MRRRISCRPMEPTSWYATRPWTPPWRGSLTTRPAGPGCNCHTGTSFLHCRSPATSSPGEFGRGASLRDRRALQATAITIVHAPREPVGRQLAGDLHALQTNARHPRTRRRPLRVRQFEDLAIEIGLLELVRR